MRTWFPVSLAAIAGAALTWAAMSASAAPPRAVITASGVLSAVSSAHDQGLASAEDVYRWSIRTAESEEAAGQTGARGRHRARMEVLRGVVHRRVEAGLSPTWEQLAADWYVEAP